MCDEKEKLATGGQWWQLARKVLAYARNDCEMQLFSPGRLSGELTNGPNHTRAPMPFVGKPDLLAPDLLSPRSVKKVLEKDANQWGKALNFAFLLGHEGNPLGQWPRSSNARRCPVTHWCKPTSIEIKKLAVIPCQEKGRKSTSPDSLNHASADEDNLSTSSDSFNDVNFRPEFEVSQCL